LKSAAYYGLDLAHNVIAKFNCKQCGEFIANAGLMIFCPHCGDRSEKVEAVIASLNIGDDVTQVGVCNVCASPIFSSKKDTSYCTQCGSVFAETEPEEDIVTDNEDEEKIEDENVGDDVVNEDAVEETEACSTEPEVESEFVPINPDIENPSKIDLHFYEGEDPFWNVNVDGIPTARISLSAQDAPEEIEAIFVSPKFGESLQRAFAQVGLKEVLLSVKAKFYANEVNSSAMAVKIRSSLEEEYDRKYQKQVADLAKDFKEAVSTVITGVNKNFWGDFDNTIKASLFEELKRYGMHDRQAVECIDTVLAESGDEFFSNIVAKALNLMSKSTEAREEITAAVKEAGVKITEVSAETKHEPNVALAKLLARNSVPITVSGADNVKSMLKSQLNLRNR